MGRGRPRGGKHKSAPLGVPGVIKQNPTHASTPKAKAAAKAGSAAQTSEAGAADGLETEQRELQASHPKESMGVHDEMREPNNADLAAIVHKLHSRLDNQDIVLKGQGIVIKDQGIVIKDLRRDAEEKDIKIEGLRTDVDTVTKDLTEFKMLCYFRDTAKALAKAIGRRLAEQDQSLSQYTNYSKLEALFLLPEVVSGQEVPEAEKERHRITPWLLIVLSSQGMTMHLWKQLVAYRNHGNIRMHAKDVSEKDKDTLLHNESLKYALPADGAYGVDLFQHLSKLRSVRL